MPLLVAQLHSKFVGLRGREVGHDRPLRRVAGVVDHEVVDPGAAGRPVHHLVAALVEVVAPGVPLELDAIVPDAGRRERGARGPLGRRGLTRNGHAGAEALRGLRLVAVDVDRAHRVHVRGAEGGDVRVGVRRGIEGAAPRGDEFPVAVDPVGEGGLRVVGRGPRQPDARRRGGRREGVLRVPPRRPDPLRRARGRVESIASGAGRDDEQHQEPQRTERKQGGRQAHTNPQRAVVVSVRGDKFAPERLSDGGDKAARRAMLTAELAPPALSTRFSSKIAPQNRESMTTWCDGRSGWWWRSWAVAVRRRREPTARPTPGTQGTLIRYRTICPTRPRGTSRRRGLRRVTRHQMTL